MNIGNNSINAVLKNDITVNADVLKENGTLADDVSGFMAWTPIGNYDNNQYNGTFDGAGCTISGLYFDDASAYNVGLFGCVGEKGVVSNVSIVDSYINADEYIGGICGENYGEVINCSNSGVLSGASYVGGVCGYNNEGTIDKCNNEGTVNGSDDVGGVCGYNNEGTIDKCNNEGTVNGTDDIGGVCGYNNGGTIKNCNNEGTVNGTDDIGGVCGYSNGTIDNCSNTGTVNGDSDSDDVGGVCGTNRGTIKNCNNTGSVSGADFVGGVFGYNWSGIIENCNNEGIVNGTNWVGGVCGKNNSSGKIKDCHNEGTVTGTGNNIGGVCGSNDGAMTNCNNTASVSGTVTESNAYIYVGGVCGYNDNGTITSCYNTGDVTASNQYAYVGGVCGNNESTIKNCYNTGSVSGTIDVGGVCGYNWGGITTNCYNIGTVTSTNDDAYIGGVCGNNYNGTIANCYYLADEETDEIDGTTFKNTSQFNSGEVAYLLSQGCTIGEGEGAVTYDGSIWGQNIDNGKTTELYPVLGGARVYYAAVYKSCAGTPEESTGSTYSNKEAIYTEHTDDDKDCLCDNCGNIMPVKAEMVAGASIRLIRDNNGIRFYTKFDAEKIAKLQAKGATVELGTLIAPQDKLTGKNLTFEDLDESEYIDVKYEAKNDDGSFIWHDNANGDHTGWIAGSIVNIKEKDTSYSTADGNIARNFVGRGYIKITLGDKSLTIYADYADGNINNNARSLASVASMLKEDTTKYDTLDNDTKALVDNWASKLNTANA